MKETGSMCVGLFILSQSVSVSYNVESSCKTSLSLGSHIRTHIYMHTQSKRFNLNPLIQLHDSAQDVDEMKSWSLIGSQREHRSSIHICVGKHWYFSFVLHICLDIEYFVCFPNLRDSWITNCKTKTTLCLFLLFTEDRNWKQIRYPWELCNGLFSTSSNTIHSFPPHPNNTSPLWMMWVRQPAPRSLRWLMLVPRREWKFRDSYWEKCGSRETGIRCHFFVEPNRYSHLQLMCISSSSFHIVWPSETKWPYLMV